MQKRQSLVLILLPLLILIIALLIIPTCDAKSKSSCKWINPIVWRKRLKVGMSEMQAIAVLGWPQNIRRESNSAFLYYQGKASRNTKSKALDWPKFGYIELVGKMSSRSSRPKYYVKSFVEPDWNILPPDTMEHPKIDRKFCVTPKGGPKWMNSESWRKLRFGLNTRQVIALLGEPKLRQRGVRQTEDTSGFGGFSNRKSDRLGEVWLFGNSGIDRLHFSYNEKISDYKLSSWAEPYWPDVIKEVQKLTKELKSKSAKDDVLKYSVLRQWKPNSVNNSLGLDILVQEETTESSLTTLVKQLAADHDPVIIRIWKSEIAWKDDEAKTSEFKSDYLLFYTKNSTDKGAFRGFNEIRWMQEVGKLDFKYGTKTKF